MLWVRRSEMIGTCVWEASAREQHFPRQHPLITCLPAVRLLAQDGAAIDTATRDTPATAFGVPLAIDCHSSELSLIEHTVLTARLLRAGIERLLINTIDD